MCAAVALLVSACTRGVARGTPRQTNVAADPPRDVSATLRHDAPASLTSMRLVIEPTDDLTGRAEVSALGDLREELGPALLATHLFADVLSAESPAAELRLVPRLIREQVVGAGGTGFSVSILVRFELQLAGSRGLIWSREYDEQSPADFAYQAPLGDRQRLVAGRVLRRRIVERVRQDLATFLLTY
jgi:hypothetical protein